MNTTTLIPFSAIDYKGINALSSYSLPITPLKFIPSVEFTRNTRMVWDFGDGTISKSFSAEKYYEFPGKYIVSLVQYDCNNNAMISSETKTITIYDYLPLSFYVIPESYVVTEDGSYIVTQSGGSVLASLLSVDIRVGQIDGPIEITHKFPRYQPALDLHYTISDSNSKNYWDIDDNKFSHLDSYNCIFERIYNYSLSSYQFNEIQKIIPITGEVYVKVLDGNIITCSPVEEGSCFAGLTGSSDFFIKDDAIGYDVLIDLAYDKTQYKNPYVDNFTYLNNLGITLSANILDNIPTYLSITSNGLDGEKFTVDSFKINPIKYLNTDIPFVVKIKDAQNFSVKNFNPIELNDLTIQVVYMGDVQLTTEDGEILLDESGDEIYANGTETTLLSTNYIIHSLNHTLSSQSSGGSFRGYIRFPSNDLLTNIKLIISGSFTNDQSLTYSLSGESNYFNVYPPNYFDIYKKNENFNATETIKDLRFQETMLDKNILFDDFIGGILGTELIHDEIGIKSYEKIANYVANTQDLDRCEIDFLESLGRFVGYNDFAEEKYVYPEKIKRLVNLLSVDKNKLVGTSNKFKENFDIKGRTSKDEYGINIGDKIDPLTYTVNADTPIVALEKFSNKYVLLNTLQPVEYTGSDNYQLSLYTSDWGWPLVLPIAFDFTDIEKYYTFFEYTYVYDDTVLGGVIDFDNNKTTVQFSVASEDLNSDNGISTHLFLDTLYQSLSLTN